MTAVFCLGFTVGEGILLELAYCSCSLPRAVRTGQCE